MACFIAPVTEAVVTTIIKKSIDKKSEKEHKEIKNPFIKRLNLLNNMLCGGSALLAFEHIWHGEVTPWFPFLTNMSNPEDAAQMFLEIATSGVAMAVLTTVVWAGVVSMLHAMEKQPQTVAVKVGGIR